MSDGVGKCFGCKTTTKIATLRGDLKKFLYELYPKYENVDIKLCIKCYIASNNTMYKKSAKYIVENNQDSQISSTSSASSSDSFNIGINSIIAIDHPRNRNVSEHKNKLPLVYNSESSSSESVHTVITKKTVKAKERPAPACIKKRRFERYNKALEEQRKLSSNYISSDEESSTIDPGVRLPNIQPIIKRRRMPDRDIETFEDHDVPIFNTSHITQEEKEEKDSFDAVASVIETAKKVFDSLRLEQVLGKEEVSTASAKEVKNLIGQVEEFKKSGILTAIQVPENRSNNLVQSIRIAALEHRLHELEQAVGAKPEKLSRLTSAIGTSNLLEAVQQLSTKAALLQSNQLDLIEAQLNNLSNKMDTIAEKSSGTNQEAQRDQKVLELYEIAKGTEPIAQVLPDMLERMQALQSLHKYATNYTKIIAELEASQNSITNGIYYYKTLLQGVQSTIAENMDNVQKEMIKLDERIKKIADKK